MSLAIQPLLNQTYQLKTKEINKNGVNYKNTSNISFQSSGNTKAFWLRVLDMLALAPFFKGIFGLIGKDFSVENILLVIGGAILGGLTYGLIRKNVNQTST